MNALTVGLITSLPVLLGMIVGSRRGGSRSLLWLAKFALSWGTGIAVAAYGLRAGWTWPIGLLSSALAGLLVAALLSRLLARRRRRLKKDRPSLGFAQRSSGLLVGGAIGFILAVTGWQIALLAMSLTSSTQLQAAREVAPQQPDKQSAWSGLAEVAHEGFLKHLPVAGPVTEELLAAAEIVKTPQDIRKRFARHKQWDSLADLPSFQAIVEDPALFADIDAATSGNLAALYRLQKHPLIIKFSREEQLQRIVTDLKASEIAAELADFQATLFQSPISDP